MGSFIPNFERRDQSSCFLIFLGAIVRSPAGGKRRAAAAGQEGKADGNRWSPNAGTNVLSGYAQHLCRLHAQRLPGCRRCRSNPSTRPMVPSEMHADAGAGGEAHVEPESGGDTAGHGLGPGTTPTCSGRCPRAGLPGFSMLPITGKFRGPSHPARSLLAGVLQAKLQRVHAALARQFINDLLAAKGGYRGSRSPVSGDARLVGNYVIALCALVGNFRRERNTHCAPAVTCEPGYAPAS